MRTTFFTNRLSRRAAILVLTGLLVAGRVNAQAPVVTKAAPTATACQIMGADTVKAGSTVTYTGHPCALTNWTTSCGTIIARSDSGITIRFTSASCTKAFVSAGSVSKSVTILPALSMVASVVAPATQTIPYNSFPGLLSADLARGGLCDGVYSYQWYSSTDSIRYSKVTGAIAKDYQPGPLTGTTWFRRTDSCALSGAVTSTIASIHVTPKPVVIAIPPVTNSNQPVTAGMLIPQSQTLTTDSISALLVCVGFNGGNQDYTFKWYSSPDGTSWTPVPGVTTPGYNPGMVGATTWYQVVVASNGNSATCTPAVIHLNSKQ